MSSIPVKDRVSLCRFTYSDRRKCRTPRSSHHPHFCFYHARLESQSIASSKLASDIQYFLSGEYVSANDLAKVLARILPAVIRGDIKPRLAKTIVYLAQTFNQTIHLAQHEYVNAYGGDAWRRVIHSNITQNLNRDDGPSIPENTDAPREEHPESSPEKSCSHTEVASSSLQRESQNPRPLQYLVRPSSASAANDSPPVASGDVGAKKPEPPDHGNSEAA